VRACVRLRVLMLVLTVLFCMRMSVSCVFCMCVCVCVLCVNVVCVVGGFCVHFIFLCVLVSLHMFSECECIVCMQVLFGLVIMIFMGVFGDCVTPINMCTVVVLCGPIPANLCACIGCVSTRMWVSVVSVRVVRVCCVCARVCALSVLYVAYM